MEHYEVSIVRSQQEMAAAFAIRDAVFVGEQHIDPAIERDGNDEEAVQFLAHADGRPVATARLLADGDDLKLGRMAVLAEFRRQGVGRALLKAMLAWAKSREVASIYLHAQASARMFYLAMGAVEEGAPHMEAGIPHQKMRFWLSE